MSAYELRILNESTCEYESLAFIQGADGKDAFTEAQKKGYTGTEAEFYAMLATHAADGVIHVTEKERSAWDGKAAGIHASQHASSGGDPITPGDIGAVSEDELNDFADQVNDVLTTHANQAIHITPDERITWNGKADGTHEHSANDVSSGTLPVVRGGTGVSSMTGSDYSTYRVRAAAILTSVPTSMENGQIAFVVTQVESSS